MAQWRTPKSPRQFSEFLAVRSQPRIHKFLQHFPTQFFGLLEGSGEAHRGADLVRAHHLAPLWPPIVFIVEMFDDKQHVSLGTSPYVKWSCLFKLCLVTQADFEEKNAATTISFDMRNAAVACPHCGKAPMPFQP